MTSNNSPLRRSFYGCLTCRKRKVRCKGGNPCQDCHRMNITCHSSFDNNFKVHVAKVPGQKLEAVAKSPPKSKTPPRVRQKSIEKSNHHSNGASRGSTKIPELVQEDSVVPLVEQSARFGIVPTTFDDAASNVYASSTTSSDTSTNFFGSIPDFDPLSLQGTWDFDFSLEPYPGFNMSEFQHAATTSYDLSKLDAPATQFRFVNSTGVETYCGDSGLPINSISKNRLGTKTVESKWYKGPPEEWTAFRKKRLKTDTPSPLVSGDPGRDSPLLMPSKEADYFYLMHYDSAIRSTYSIKDDARWSYFAFVLSFIQQCSPELPFRMAVLAWTAKHFAVNCAPGDDAWIGYYAKASSEVTRLLGDESVDDTPSNMVIARPAVSSRPEVVICTSLFLCRCDVLANDSFSLSSRLQRLTKWLSEQPVDLHLSAFACKVLFWLSILHVRLAIFHTSPKVESTLLDVLSRRQDHESIMSHGRLYLVEIFGPSYPRKDIAEDAQVAPVSHLLYETFCLISSMLQYRAWKRGSSSGTDDQDLCTAKIAAIDADSRRINAEFSLAIATNPSASILRLDCDSWDHPAVTFGPEKSPEEIPGPRVDRTTLHWLTCYAAFLTSKILWSRILRPSIRTDAVSVAAVGTIMRIALRLRKAKYRKTVRSMLWPLPLFVAGIETTDEVYANWIKTFMEEAAVAGRSAGNESAHAEGKAKRSPGDGGGASGGTGGEKVRQLMMEIRRRQSREGRRVEVEEVIRDMSGELDSFVF